MEIKYKCPYCGHVIVKKRKSKKDDLWCNKCNEWFLIDSKKEGFCLECNTKTKKMPIEKNKITGLPMDKKYMLCDDCVKRELESLFKSN